jgi:hypothetical protein
MKRPCLVGEDEIGDLWCSTHRDDANPYGTRWPHDDATAPTDPRTPTSTPPETEESK